MFVLIRMIEFRNKIILKQVSFKLQRSFTLPNQYIYGQSNVQLKIDYAVIDVKHG